ncbi:MAG: hypothetical protein ACRYHQ_12580 [Janthinobacterium lividum]
MSASAAHTAPQDDSGPPAAGTHGHGEALNDLISMGTDIARRLHGHAMAQPQPAQQASASANQPPAAQSAPASAPAPSPAPDALIRTAASFDQIARAVRRCIALAHHLDAPKQQRATRDPAEDRTTARKRIIRAVEDVIQRPPDNDECDDAEVLLSDLRERMDTPDLEDDIANRPAEDIIKEILRDLGLAALPGSRPWKRRTPTDIAELNARAAAPSTPRQPGSGPQDGHPAATQPAHPAAPARLPTRPGDVLPDDPAEAVAFVLHHHARPGARWRPPPGD